MKIRNFVVVALTCVCAASETHLSYPDWNTPATLNLHWDDKLTNIEEVDAQAIMAMIDKANTDNIQFTIKDKTEVDCLARNIYFESRNQSLNGQLAVALVTFNRVHDPRFPKSICSTVYQRNKHGCAFSWVCQGRKVNWHDHIEINAWYSSYKLALQSYAIRNQIVEEDFTHGATFYHSIKVNPDWASNEDWEQIAMIGDHIFYIWKG